MRLRVKNKIYSVVQLEENFDGMTGLYNVSFTFADFKGYVILISLPEDVKDVIMQYVYENGYFYIDENYDYILKV